MLGDDGRRCWEALEMCRVWWLSGERGGRRVVESLAGSGGWGGVEMGEGAREGGEWDGVGGEGGWVGVLCSGAGRGRVQGVGGEGGGCMQGGDAVVERAHGYVGGHRAQD